MQKKRNMRKEKYCKKINSDFYVFYSRAQTVKYNMD